MSSTEQAPEPTMDEILASIRRIIADDENGSMQRPEPPAEAAAQPEDQAGFREPAASGDAQGMVPPFGQGDRGQGQVQVQSGRPAADPEDDILDLTSEMFSGPRDFAEPEPAAPRAPATPPAPAPMPSPAASDPYSDPRDSAPGLPQFGNEFRTARADTPAPEPDPVRYDDIVAARPQAPSPAFEPEPAAAPYAPPVMPEEARRPEPAPAAAQPAPAPAESNPPPVPDGVGEGAGAKPAAEAVRGSVSLEECVRDLLRPMLRDWVDHNLPRILEDAARQELAAQMREKQREH